MSDADVPDQHEPWRDLRVGDRIRIVRMPTEFSREGYVVGDEMLALYQHLIDTGAVLTIFVIHSPDLPWIAYTWVRAGSEDEYHGLAVNDDSWERVDEFG